MLVVTCASWAGTPNLSEGKWSAKIGFFYYYIEDGMAVLTNANMKDVGSASTAAVYDGDLEIPNSINYEGETIPVVGIQDFAFYYCPELTSVTIPSSIATIGDNVFSKCPKLENIKVKDSNNYFYSKDGLLYSKSNELLAVPAGKKFANNKFTLPSTITKINNYAFDGCVNITSITLPSSLTTIGFYAFNECTNLETINIPSGISSIGKYAFFGCSKLDIDFVLPKNMHEVPQGIFYNCKSLKKVRFNSSTTCIGTESFYGCSSLTSVQLPANITEISPKAFYGTGLTSIEIPGSVEIISNSSFSNTKLTSVKINEGVKIIDQSAFSGLASNLLEVSLPTSVTNINNYAFSKSYVKDYYIHTTASQTELGDFSIFQKSEGMKIHVFQGLADEFKNAKNWSKYEAYIVDDIENSSAQNDIVTLFDGVDYTNSTDKSVKKVIYSRTYKNTNWQALYLPFDMSYEDWKDNFEVAIINNIHQYDDNNDGNVDRTTIEILKIKDGKTVKAHTPCMIRAFQSDSKNAQTITVENVTLKKAEKKSTDCSSITTRFTFNGIYTRLSGTEMVENHLYGMAGGKFNLATDPTKSLGGYRWYLEITDRNSAKSSYSKSADIDIICLDDEDTATDINSVESDNNDIVAIYDINGRMLNDLQKGINIVKYSNGTIKKISKK